LESIAKVIPKPIPLDWSRVTDTANTTFGTTPSITLKNLWEEILLWWVAFRHDWQLLLNLFPKPGKLYTEPHQAIRSQIFGFRFAGALKDFQKWKRLSVPGN
jgi:hypothetical protein